jgi:hypothetical protein
LGEIIYSHKGIKDKVAKFGEKYKNLGHTLNLFEFNCVDKMSHIISTADYSTSGNVIWVFSLPSG